MAELKIIITHGLGAHPPDFWKPLAQKLAPLMLAIEPFYYHDIFQHHQENGFKEYEHLKNNWARKFIYQNVSDGVTYREPNIYKEIHAKLKGILNGEPCVIIAPSMSGQIISDHIWDAQQKVNAAHINIKLLITNGCNIPLFISGIPKDKVRHFKQDFKWHNYYDPADVLGFPLQPTGHQAKDIEIHTYLSLYSHLRYWHNRKFIKSIIKSIDNL